jgi:hypothetical protein
MQKVININKVIREIESNKYKVNKHLFLTSIHEEAFNYGLKKAIQIIKDNIKERDYCLYNDNGNCDE